MDTKFTFTIAMVVPSSQRKMLDMYIALVSDGLFSLGACLGQSRLCILQSGRLGKYSMATKGAFVFGPVNTCASRAGVCAW